MRKARLAVISVAVAALGGTAACGGEAASSTGTPESGIPQEIRLAAVHDLTGPVAFGGVGARDGAAVAIAEINSTGYLGDGVTLTIEENDAAGDIDRAVSEMTRVMNDPDVAAIIGPVAGQQAAAIAPVVEREKVPTVFTQAGADGVVIGDYTFRITPTMASFYHIAADYMAEEGLDDTVVVYNASYPTSTLLEESFRASAAENGIEIVETIAVQESTQDFTAQAGAVARLNPSAVNVLLAAPQTVTFVAQLRQAGYEGRLVGMSGHSGGNLVEAGEDAVGMVYPVSFSPAQEDAGAKTFVELFEAEHGRTPDLYAAEGYDAVWWIAHAIKEMGSADRQAIQEGLQRVAEKGFSGAMGDLTFDGNDSSVKGTMVIWDGENERLI